MRMARPLEMVSNVVHMWYAYPGVGHMWVKTAEFETNLSYCYMVWKWRRLLMQRRSGSSPA